MITRKRKVIHKGTPFNTPRLKILPYFMSSFNDLCQLPPCKIFLGLVFNFNVSQRNLRLGGGGVLYWEN
jgi:hypothetical protein